jgi:hypothetical protein
LRPSIEYLVWSRRDIVWWKGEDSAAAVVEMREESTAVVVEMREDSAAAVKG